MPSALSQGAIDESANSNETQTHGIRKSLTSSAGLKHHIADQPKSPGRRRLKDITKKTASASKYLLSVQKEKPSHPKDGLLPNLEDNPAFNTSKLHDERHRTATSKREELERTVRSVGRTVIHPIDSIKDKATRATASKLSKAERPYLSRHADLEFLEAHDELDEINLSRSTSQESRGDDDILAEERLGRVKSLEAHREGLRAAWTMRRHVERVRVVPKGHFRYPDKALLSQDGDANYAYSGYLKWLGHFILWYTQGYSAQYVDDFEELPFNIDSTRHHLERLIIASAPWQSWAMSVRSIYRWEHPATTAKWFALYLVLWYTQHMMGFLYSYIIYLAMRNRFYPSSIRSLREHMHRAHDQQAAASKFGELIDRHGSDKWVKPLLAEISPHAQLQLGDIANMLEVFRNFYAWTAPKKTAGSLFFFSSCLLVSLLADMEFCMKIVWFIVGGSFFLCWPISSLYPKYRYLVSPIKWVFWDIPTDSQWSFQLLRQQAQADRQRLIEKNVDESSVSRRIDPLIRVKDSSKIPDVKADDARTQSSEDEEDEDWHSVDSFTSVLDHTDLRAFRAQYHGSIGQLLIHSAGVRFVRSMPRKEVWNRTFLELVEMKKSTNSKLHPSAFLSSQALELQFTDGTTLCLDGIKDRDAAFNTIIGFSSLQWQSM